MDKLVKLLEQLDLETRDVNYIAQAMRDKRIEYAEALYDLPTHKERMDAERAAQNDEAAE